MQENRLISTLGNSTNCLLDVRVHKVNIALQIFVIKIN